MFIRGREREKDNSSVCTVHIYLDFREYSNRCSPLCLYFVTILIFFKRNSPWFSMRRTFFFYFNRFDIPVVRIDILLQKSIKMFANCWFYAVVVVVVVVIFSPILTDFQLNLRIATTLPWQRYTPSVDRICVNR